MRAGSKPVIKTLQLKNTGKKDVEYEAEVIMHDQVTSDPYKPQPATNVNDIKVELSTDEVEADGNDTESFTLKLSSARTRTTKTGVYEGEVLLRSKDGNPDLHLPFAVHIGDEPEETNFGFANVKLSDTVISPDGKYKLRLIGALIDPTKPEAEQLVKYYEAWKAFAIENAGNGIPQSAAKSVKEAAANFKGEATNTTELDKPVLTLPDDSQEVTFKVTNSTDDTFISDEGVLLQLPAKSKKTVTLTVTISSTEDVSVKETKKVKVTLEPAKAEQAETEEQAETPVTA